VCDLQQKAKHVGYGQSQKDLRRLQNGSAAFSHVDVKGLISCSVEQMFVCHALKLSSESMIK